MHALYLIGHASVAAAKLVLSIIAASAAAIAPPPTFPFIPILVEEKRQHLVLYWQCQKANLSPDAVAAAQSVFVLLLHIIWF